MFAQGKSLGRQLLVIKDSLITLCEEANAKGGSVWFLGRYCDVFHGALKGSQPNTRYIAGLNRENAKKMQHRSRLTKWLKSIGVRPGDVLVDSGFNGSIYSRIEEDNPKFFGSIRCILITANPGGHCGEPLMPESTTNGKLRNAVLALEHSPKREVSEWDSERRLPSVSMLGGKKGEAARRFYNGFVKAIKEGQTCK